ncbi:hypothetical protein ElyMa_003757200 [Elysia marginata]|uniref:Uncharacterized protein n=1 Tax=Elysia marginata TaxID=1093978 RepID=A0AAV4F892_9GAST|nr:hypothetical protein ElyMa_003757200 [Elysia marginata]
MSRLSINKVNGQVTPRLYDDPRVTFMSLHCPLLTGLDFSRALGEVVTPTPHTHIPPAASINGNNDHLADDQKGGASGNVKSLNEDINVQIEWLSVWQRQPD